MLDARAFLARTLGFHPEFQALAILAAADSFADLGGPRPALAAARADPASIETVAFLLQHEAHHLGRLGLLRRELGLPAARDPSGPAT